MKQILIFSAVLLFAACKPSNYEEDKHSHDEKGKLSKDSNLWSQTVEEFTYEGCEYIAIDIGKDRWGSHKGNCKNPIHNQ